MKNNFSFALAFVLRHECVFLPGHYGDLNNVATENVPGDSGGLTKYGIDQADHPGVDIAALTYDQAAQIYQDGEWTACRCDDLPEDYDLAMFDTAVNNGCGTAARLLQEACNAVNTQQVPVDGAIGPATVNAAMMAGQPGLRQFLLMRERHYGDIARDNPAMAKFFKGWTARVNDLASALNININAVA